MSSDAPKPKRCPRGTRRNKQGICVGQNEPKISEILVDPSVAASNLLANAINTSLVPVPVPGPVQLKRCARGTRRNKQGVCVPTKVPVEVPVEVPAEVPAEVPVEVPVEVPAEVPVKASTKRCARGTRRNKQGICVPNKIQIEPAVEPAIEPAIEATIEPAIEATAEPIFPITRPPPPPEKEPEKEPAPEAVSETEKEPVPETVSESVQEPAPETVPETVSGPEKEPEETSVFDTLYPLLGDTDFSQKIARKQEFNETRYDGTIRDIKATAEKLCNVGFELLPHQLFVRNFLSLQTPYNSLLMYHGLGSGKTCSAIGICEEMRQYMKQMGIRQRIKGGSGIPRIIIVASPNVQENFRLQLFDPSKLAFKHGRWNLPSCVGESLLSEINPTQLPTTDTTRDRERIVTSMRNLINTYYVMMGYVQFSNFVAKAAAEGGSNDPKTRRHNLRRYFNHRLIVVDEVHNIRISDDNSGASKATANALFEVAETAENVRLVLLSATPLYNSYKEVVWWTNLMNVNDRRSRIKISDVFDAHGEFKSADADKGSERNIRTGKAREDTSAYSAGRRSDEYIDKGSESGRELLIRKLTGYVSYVRGENPYTFPYRVIMGNQRLSSSSSSSVESGSWVQVSPIGEQQRIGYLLIMDSIVATTAPVPVPEPVVESSPTITGGVGPESSPASSIELISPAPSPLSQIAYKAQQECVSTEEEPEQGIDVIEETGGLNNLGYEQLLNPLMGLNMIYPTLPQFVGEPKDRIELLPKSSLSMLVGKLGLQATMDSVDKSNARVPERYGFQYKAGFDRLFAPEHIHKYSGKIATICQCIRESVGIVMIYSQFIDGGLVPMALALEEMGLTRYVSGESAAKPLLHASLSSTIVPLDALTMQQKPNIEPSMFRPASYVMITGDKAFSHNNVADLRALNHADNRYGANIKVVLISKAAAEGLDFKNIRQIHIMEPWYNLNRIEQIIGRGVRNLSHCALPFEERNVEIYMHTTEMKELYPTLTVSPTVPAPGTEGNEGGENTTSLEQKEQKEVVGGENTTSLEQKEQKEKEVVQVPVEVPAEVSPAETVDQYIYKMAYRKSSKIGQVTRLIKTLAVDCVLNIAQTHFTADKLQQLVANQRIRQRLSSGRGKEIVYQMGDKPYTDLCDYQSSCEFKCTNTGTNGTDSGTQGGDNVDIDRTTYTQLHTHTNLHQIMDRIRKLFRESTYYHQLPLIRAINIQREYPINHIYATLTYMIENRNEILVDSLGRNGYLVNHGDVYLFQPIEITDETVSIHDRSVPVDYRRDRVVLDVPSTLIPFRTDILGSAAEPNVAPTTALAATIAATLAATTDKSDEAAKVKATTKIINIEVMLDDLRTNVDRAMRGEPPTDIPAKQWDWYSHASLVFDEEWKRVHGWKDADLEQMIVDHAVESMMPMERLALVTEGAASGYKPLQTYLAKQWVASNRPGDARHGWWILVDNPKEPLQLFVSAIEIDGSWTKADPEDANAFPIKISVPSTANLTPNIGFFSIFDHKQMVFKVRDMTKKRNIGARMDSAGKVRVIELVNAVQDEVNYTIESTKRIHQMGVCVILEALMRRPRSDGKRAFLLPEEAILL